VKEVELLSHFIASQHIGECGNAIILIDSSQVMLQMLGDSFLLALHSQSFTKIIIRREDYTSSRVVLHIGLISHSVLSESRLTQIKNLLRSPTALERERRASENSFTTSEIIPQD